jgi:hypothetical protein
MHGNTRNGGRGRQTDCELRGGRGCEHGYRVACAAEMFETCVGDRENDGSQIGHIIPWRVFGTPLVGVPATV